jgi:hypothetical protein
MDAGRVRPRTPGQGLAAPWIPAKEMSVRASRITVIPLADESVLGDEVMTTGIYPITGSILSCPVADEKLLDNKA